MAEDLAAVDGQRGHARADLHEGHAVLLLRLGEDRTRHGVREEHLARGGDAHLVEHDVEVAHRLLGAHEDLEVAFDGVGGHAHDIVLAGADQLVVGREGLRHGAVDLLLAFVGDGVGVDGDALEGVDLVAGDAGRGVAALHARAGDLLPDVIARQAHDHLEDLDVQFFFRLLDGGA